MVKFKDLKEDLDTFSKEFCKALNDNTEYEIAAKGWGVNFEGAMLLVYEAGGDLEDNIRIFLDLKDGKCLGIKILNPEEEPPRSPVMTVRGNFEVWSKMRTTNLNPMKALMGGQLKLEGDMSLVMRYARAASLLGSIAGKQESIKKLFQA